MGLLPGSEKNQKHHDSQAILSTGKALNVTSPPELELQ